MSAGLYIHIPFCVRKCSYCDFYSLVATPQDQEDYAALLSKEAKLRGRGQPVSTVFFGGGTPSLLSPDTIATILRELRRYFSFVPPVEITLEANPESLSRERLLSYREAGVNRLSLGVQSLESSLLSLLGRHHTGEAALEALSWARSAGFNNISCDLIYGIPGQTLAHWQQDLKTLTASEGLTHLSLYSLELHRATPLGLAAEEDASLLPDDDLAADMYLWAREFLPTRGILQYELANFALAGYACRHNLNYWQNGDYFGLGPAACSYLAGVRRCNEANLERYKSVLLAGHLPPADSEALLFKAKAAETLILALRLIAGVDREAFVARFGLTPEAIFPDKLATLRERGWIKPTAVGFALSSEMLPLANQVFSLLLPDI